MLRPFSINPGNQKILYKSSDECNEYADVYMQKPGQDEDLMNEAHNETPSAYDVIQESLSNSLQYLSSNGKQVLIQQYSVPIPNKSIFQAPERIFMKEANKESWLDDLSNPSKPLSEVALAKIPLIRFGTGIYLMPQSSLKDSKVLHICVERQVPFSRAIWFIKCIGLNEMRPQKSAPTIDQNQNASKDWTKIVFSFLVENINGLGADGLTSRKAGQSHTIKFEDTFSAKLKKLVYLIHFCKIQYDENLINRHDFLRHTLLLLQKASNLNQIPSLIFLVYTFLSEYGNSRFLSKQLAYYSLAQLQRLKTVSAIEESRPIFMRLRALIQHVFLLYPDIFVSNSVWKASIPLRDDIFIDNTHTLPLCKANELILKEKYIRGRASRLFPAFKVKEKDETVSQVLMNLYNSKLNISSHFRLIHTDSELLKVFNYPLEGGRLNIQKLYASCALLHQKSDQSKLQSFLFGLLDSRIGGEEFNRNYFYQFRTLQDFGLFSWEEYLQHFVINTERNLKNLNVLSSFALRNPSPRTLSERRMWFQEIAQEDESSTLMAKNLVAACLPGMFSSDLNVFLNLQEPFKDTKTDANSKKDIELLDSFSKLKPFVQMQICEWLRDSTFLYIVHPQTIGINNWKTLSVPGTSVLSSRQFSLIVAMLEKCHDYHTLLEICVWLLEKTFDQAILRSVIYVFQRHRFMYTTHGFSKLIYETIGKKYFFDKTKYHIYPSLYQITKYYNDMSGFKKDLSFLTANPKAVSKKSVSDFSYLKEIKSEGLLSTKICSRLIADCISEETAQSILLQVIDILQATSDNGQAGNMVRDLSLYSTALVELLEAGTFIESGFHLCLSKVVNSSSFERVVFSNWFYELLVNLIANQAISLIYLLSEIVIPKFKDSAPIKTPKIIKNWFHLLEIIFLGKCSTFVVNAENQIERSQSLNTVYSFALRDRSCDSVIFDLLSTLSGVLADKSILSKVPEMTAGINEFILALCKSPNWFKERFSYSCDEKQCSLIMKESTSVLISTNLLCQLLSTEFKAPSGVQEFKSIIGKLLINSSVINTRSLNILFQFAEIMSKKGDQVWHEGFSYSMKLLLNNILLTDLQSLTVKFSEGFRAPFLSYLSNDVIKYLEITQSVFNANHTSPQLEWNSDRTFEKQNMVIFSNLITGVFGSSNELTTDEAKKELRPVIIRLLSSVIQAFISFQTWGNALDVMESNSSFLDACEHAGVIIEGNSELYGFVKFQDVCSIFQSYTSILTPVTRFIVSLQDELNVVPLIQALLMLLNSKFLQKRGAKKLYDTLFDIATVLSDDLSKQKSKEMGQWIIEVFAPNVKDDVRLKRLLPFQEKCCLLQGLKVSNPSQSGDSVSTESLYARPWEFIEHGINSSTGEVASWWSDPTAVADLNDTCISLSHFGARKIRPRRNTFDVLYEYGWRPSLGENKMKVDENEPFVLPEKVIENSKKRAADSLLEQNVKKK